MKNGKNTKKSVGAKTAFPLIGVKNKTIDTNVSVIGDFYSICIFIIRVRRIIIIQAIRVCFLLFLQPI